MHERRPSHDTPGAPEGAARLRADFSQRAMVDTEAAPWVASPAAGVLRKLLDRVGEERARATSLVRYVPGSRFPEHDHPGGEELFVLEGVLEDEHGAYPAGTYLRNPPGSRHAPRSAPGCVLFVKLWQIPPDEGHRVVIDTGALPWQPSVRPGLHLKRLYESPWERVSLLRFSAGVKLERHEHPDGEELFVLQGSLRDEHGTYRQGTWLRQPAGSAHSVVSEQGCITLSKAGHLSVG